MIYFVFGNDSYRAKQKVAELIKKYQTGFELQKIFIQKTDGENKINGLIEKLKSVSLWPSKKMLLVENLSQNANQKLLADFLKSNPKVLNDNIIIFYEDKVDKKTSLYKFLLKNAEKFEGKQLSPGELKKWAQAYIKKNKGDVDSAVLTKILANKKANLWSLSNELDKLLSFDKKITLANAHHLMVAGFDDNIFNLVDALGNGDKKTALYLINKQLESGVEPLYLLAMMARQFRILLKIKDMILNKKITNFNLLAKELSLPFFVVQKTVGQAEKYNFFVLKQQFKKILQLDLDLKTKKNSAQVLFTRFIFA